MEESPSSVSRGNSMAKFTKKTKIAALTAALVVGATGTAFAYWTMSGAGTGDVKAGTTVAVVVKQTNVAITDLYPGGAAKALTGNFDNSNDGPVTVGKVSAVIESTDVSGCLTSWYVIEGSDLATTHVIPKGVAQSSWSGLSVRMLNDAANSQDMCKGATITITYTVAVPVA